MTVKVNKNVLELSLLLYESQDTKFTCLLDIFSHTSSSWDDKVTRSILVLWSRLRHLCRYLAAITFVVPRE